MRIRQTPIPIRKLHQLRHPQKQVRSMQLITGILPRRMPRQIPHHQVLPSLPIQITIHQSPISHRQLFIMPESQLTNPQQMPFPIFRRQSGQTHTKQLNGRPTPKLAQQSLQIFHKIFHFHDHRGNIYPCAAEGRIPHLYMDHQGIHKNRTGLLTSPKGERRPVQNLYSISILQSILSSTHSSSHLCGSHFLQTLPWKFLFLSWRYTDKHIGDMYSHDWHHES